MHRRYDCRPGVWQPSGALTAPTSGGRTACVSSGEWAEGEGVPAVSRLPRTLHFDSLSAYGGEENECIASHVRCRAVCRYTEESGLGRISCVGARSVVRALARPGGAALPRSLCMAARFLLLVPAGVAVCSLTAGVGPPLSAVRESLATYCVGGWHTTEGEEGPATR